MKRPSPSVRLPLRRSGRALGAVLFFALAGPAVRAADAPPDSVLSTHEAVGFVLLPVTVTNAKGKPVTHLAQSDFLLYDNGQPQEIEFFTTEKNLPVSVAFVLDVSGSMGLGGKLERAKEAINAFVSDLEVGDRVGMICFADQQVVWVTRFTGDHEDFLRRLAVQEAYGATAIYDALAASPGLVDAAERGRSAIVLVTDGLDNASQLSTVESMWIARRLRVPIYVLDFVSSDPERLRRNDLGNLEVLGRFAEETGGAIWPVQDREHLSQAIAAIQGDLRFQYLLGFAAASGGASFRPVRVETRRGSLRIRTRSGYYANP